MTTLKKRIGIQLPDTEENRAVMRRIKAEAALRGMRMDALIVEKLSASNGAGKLAEEKGEEK